MGNDRLQKLLGKNDQKRLHDRHQQRDKGCGHQAELHRGRGILVSQEPAAAAAMAWSGCGCGGHDANFLLRQVRGRRDHELEQGIQCRGDVAAGLHIIKETLGRT